MSHDNSETVQNRHTQSYKQRLTGIRMHSIE